VAYKKDANTLFLHSKKHARERGIAFKFTKDEWVSWWKKHLGPDWITKRGCRLGQYVMARIADKGDYEPNNVRCITSSENHNEKKMLGNHAFGIRIPTCKLTEAQVLSIRQSKKTGRQLADKYRVHTETIRYIRLRKTWQHLP
jgi:hypothetical protein